MIEGSGPHALLEGITRRDFDAVQHSLDASAQMRALLPGQLLEVSGAEAIVARFRSWFEPASPFAVLASVIEPLPEKVAVRYRFRLHHPQLEGENEIEQHLFCVASDGVVEHIDLICSGFLATKTPSRTTSHEFDAGTLGCTDGLATAFRSRIKEVAVGDLLHVHTVDPSAKEDLPSLARLMGHAVHSVEARADGGLTIIVERGK